MAASDTENLRSDFEALTVTLQELGIMGSKYGKTAGIIERETNKLWATFHKNPVVKLGKQIKGLHSQTKLFNKIISEKKAVSEEDREEQMKGTTSLTKLMISMVAVTRYGKKMNKMVLAGKSAWSMLAMKVFALFSIFLIVGFALAAVSIALQGAESPLLKYTDGIWGVDHALQGLIMALTGEGEGGLYGAINIVAAAMIIAIPIAFLFGFEMAALAASIVIVVGAYQLVKKGTGDTDAAMAAAIITAVALAGAFMMINAALTLGTTSLIILEGSLMWVVGSFLIAVALIAGGLLGLYLFATGKVTGWLGWALAAVSAFAIGVGVVLLFGFTWPIVFLVAAIALLVAIVFKYKDEIMYDLGRFANWIMRGVDKGIEKLVTGCAYIVGLILAIVAVVVGIIMFASHSIIGIIVFPFIFVGKFIAALWKDWKASGKSGWRGFLSWVGGVGPKLGKMAKSAFKDAFNTVITLYNQFAEKFKVDVPKWVTKATGVTSFKIPQIPKMAKGGIVNSPTLALIGEDGPEAVVPLSRKNNPEGIGLGGGDKNITINVNASGITDRSDKRALAREIGEAIREEMSRGGRSYGSRRGAL